MRRLAQKFIFFCCLLVGSTHITAANYYFSTSTGDDARSFAVAQSPATPWQSIAKFNEIFTQLQPGDAVYFQRGEVFYGEMILDRSGSGGAPIIIGAYGSGAKPIISGFTTVSQWTSIGNGRYESPVLNTSVDVNMVVINGTNYAVGRYPNADAPNAGYMTMESVNGNTITSSALSGNPSWSGGQLVIRTSHWTFHRVPVNTQSGNTISFSGSTSYEAREGYGFFVQRHINTLDQFGEWYFNPSTKKITVYFGSQGPTDVQVSTLDVLASFKGDNLRVENLVFEGANDYALGNNGHNVDDFVISNCDVRFTGQDGILFKGANGMTFENSTITHSNNCGAKLLYCTNATLSNNDIYFSGMQAGMGGDGDGNYTGVISEERGFVAEYNNIINTGYIGLRFGIGDNLIKNNYIDTFCAVLDDGAGIYTYDSDGDIANRKVIGNIVLNGVGANPGTNATIYTAAEGIYLDDNANNIEVSGNTTAWCGSNGLFVHNAQNFIIRNNTFYNNPVQFLLKSDAFGTAISGASITDNIYFSKDVSETVFHVNSDANDIGNMGTMNNNYYVRPLYDELPILAEYQNGSGVKVKTPMDLPEWRSAFGHGQQSQKSPVELDAYTINSLIGGNSLPNETFDNDIGGLWCFSPYSDCDIDWIGNSILDGGALQVSGPSPSRIGMNCGALLDEKKYIVRFSAAASQAATMEVYYMEGESPWEIISPIVAVQLGTERQDYEILMTSNVDNPPGTIQFQFGRENTTYWLDNVQMYEADISAADPDEYIRFEYNASQQNKSVVLSDDYVDAKNTAYSGSVTLAPYESLVLIKVGEGTGNPTDSDGDGVPDAVDQCPGFDDNLDTDGDVVPDGCDECPGFDDNLDTDGDRVPDGCDECPGFDDNLDTDGDGVPDGCDECPGFDDNLDTDGDGVPDGCDECPGFDDTIDLDNNGTPDGCDEADCADQFGINCPDDDCLVSEEPILFDLYTASQKITSDGWVISGNELVFIAGEEIILKPGFLVEEGASFNAKILICESTGNSLVTEQDKEWSSTALKLEPPVSKKNSDTDWSIYPNPVRLNSELNIRYYTLQKEVTLHIMDQYGRMVGRLKSDAGIGWNEIRLPIKDQLAAGKYYIYDANTLKKAYPFMVAQ